jgi:hypothetical protein
MLSFNINEAGIPHNDLLVGCTYNAYTNPILIKHQILPYPFLIKQAQLTVMHSIYYNYAPASFNDVWQKSLNATLK